jgi:phospholipase C
MPPTPDHVIVLILENRSFDHMLGFLDHPDPTLKRLTGTESNILEPGAPPIVVNPNAQYTIYPDPDHSHRAVMCQLTGTTTFDLPYKITNSGFAWDYARVAEENGYKPSHGATIMQCQAPTRLPVLRGLANNFAVCDHWFCSVPGQTWPNRNFAIAATSDGEVDIRKRPYWNKTIFEHLDSYDVEWFVFHDGLPHVWVFPKLWSKALRKRYKPTKELYELIASDRLPRFSYVEPDHFGSNSSSQHPGNNAQNGRDFLAAEQLIMNIYQALADNPEVMKRTLFLITYDEHGGFFDHVAPPQSDDFRDGKTYRKGDYEFSFDLLGPRVPAVLVSPYIPPGTVDHTQYDHSSIVATLRELFTPGSPPLTPRDEKANSFHNLLSLETPREIGAVLKFKEEGVRSILQSTDTSSVPVTQLDEFQLSLIWLAEEVERGILQEEAGGPTAAKRGLWWDEFRHVRSDITTVAKAESYQKHVVSLMRSTAIEI